MRRRPLTAKILRMLFRILRTSLGKPCWWHGGAAAAIVAVLFAWEGVALACPFCGGRGAEGLLQNLLMVAVFGFIARGIWRARNRRHGGRRH